MTYLVFDLEANGLLEEVDTAWVACWRYDDGCKLHTTDIDHFCNILSSYSGIIVGHNIIGYDLPLLEKLYGYKHEGKVLDTLVLSRLLNPERVGRHGLGAWGERFGVPKPKHEDWSRYSEAMLYRCQQDVEINQLTLDYLLEESGLTIEEIMEWM